MNPQKKERKGATPAKVPFLRLLFSFLLLAAVVFGCSSLTQFMSTPVPEASASSEPEMQEEAGPATPTPLPTPTPTPAEFAPFGSIATAVPTPESVQVTAQPSPVSVSYKTLKKGAKGDDVVTMQKALIDLGYLDDVADGNFGNNTHTALIMFQAVNNLTADGIAGEKTLTLLYSGNAKNASEAPDMDFLILVNRKHTLPENYVPFDLCNIESVLPASLVKVKYSGTKANRTAVDALGRMLEDAQSQGISNWQISSAYRTYQEQQKLVNNSVASYQKNHPSWSKSQCLSATYNTVAPAGASEHQTGLSFDLTVPGVSFAGTEQQKWLHKHCHEYGFIVRYTEDKKSITGFIAEAWHIRYVGVEVANIMVRNNWCLEEYVENMHIQ